MKRALLIAGGSIGGLGAVLAITPPQLSSTELALPSGSVGSTSDVAANTGTASSVSSSSPAASASASSDAAVTTKTTSATKSSTATKSANTTAKSSTTATTNSSTSTNSNTSTAQESPTPTPTPSKTVAKSAGVTGEFTGSAINIGYGMMQVKITVVNGKITDAVAVQAPSGRNDRWTSMAVPVLKQQTLAAQGDGISGVSGASYTSYGWYKSLQSALSKAGML